MIESVPPKLAEALSLPWFAFWCLARELDAILSLSGPSEDLIPLSLSGMEFALD